MRDCLCLILYLFHFSEGCYISHYTVYKTVTVYAGGSVLLPCACKDYQSKPETGFTWSYFNQTQNKWTDVFKDEKYKNRLKLFNHSSPANLSLLISDLRKKDEGVYWCQTTGNFTVIKLTVKGCDLDQNKQTLQLTGRSREVIVLPCSCSQLQDTPQQHKWTFTPLKQTKPEEIHQNNESKQHKGRVKLLNEISPGNLSLQISNLTKDDEGEYHCSMLHQHINITLSVHETPTTEQSEAEPVKQFFILVSVLTVLLLCVLASIYWICRERRPAQTITSAGLVVVCSENGEEMGDVNPDSLIWWQNLKQDENEAEVTYSSVVYVKTTAKPHIETEHSASNESDYTTMKL